MTSVSDLADDEVWRPVLGYEGVYEVSNLGRVRSLDRYVRTVSRAGRETRRFARGTLLKPQPHPSGYLQVGIRGESRLVHMLVAAAFLGAPPSGLIYVCHGDGVKTRNVPSNLRYDTPQGNSGDMALHGTRLFGEANPAAKITASHVIEIRRRHAQGWTYEDIAIGLPVSSRAVGKIVRRERWKHV